MAEKIKCDCGITFEVEEGQTHCNYCGIKLSDIGKEKPAYLAKEDKATLGEKKKGRGCLIAIGLLIGFFILIAAISSGGEKKKSVPTPTPVKQEEGKPTPTERQEEKVEKKEETSEEQIKKLVQKHLEGNNNLGYPYEEKIEITQNSKGKYTLNIEFNAADNLSKGLIKTGVQMKISEILIALFTQRDDIQKVTIAALFPLQDKYGNPFRGAVYVAELDSVEAKKVNWNIDSATLALSILPKVYKTSYPYKIF